MPSVVRQIDRLPDAKAHQSVLYRAGIYMRDVEKPEVDNLIEQRVEATSSPTY